MSDVPFEVGYGSARHERIVKAVQSRYQLSRNEMRDNHERWRRAERQHQLYVPLSELDKNEQTKHRDKGEPTFTRLVVPYSYAMVMSAHTYHASVFLSRAPIFQYTGTNGESESQTQAVESIIQYQTDLGGLLVPLYIWLLDPLKYGIGILGTYWADEQITRSSYEEIQDMVGGIPIEGTKKKVKRIDRIAGYQGSKAYNVRPWDFFPDPRVPLYKCDQGEFCGRTVEVGWNTIIKRQQAGTYFNIEKLREARASRLEGQDIGFEPGDGIRLPNSTMDPLAADDISDTSYVKLLEMHVELVPKDWDLGNTEYPEKWVFTVANPETRGIVIGAQPLGESHDRFPFFVLESDVEGYNLSKRSMYDVLEPLQQTMDFLVNTHFYNVRRALNDMVAVDPTRIVMRDMLEPGPGKLIRAKPAAYGTRIADAFFQFQMQDVTTQHLNDVSLISNLMQRVSGVSDNIMGLMAQRGRPTATEVRQATNLGINRLKTMSEYFSAMGFTPLSRMLVQMTQQHFEGERVLRIVGDAAVSGGQKYVNVNPEMIAGFYDFIPADGNMPVDRMAQVSLWTQLLAQMRNFPELAQRYDIGAIFGWVAQLGGLRNIDQFRVQVVPDQAAQQGLQAGNLMPAGAGGQPSRAVDPATFLAARLGAGAGRTQGSGPAL